MEKNQPKMGQKKLSTPKFINHKFLKEDTLINRKYQTRIFITATQSNCLVVIPTGLGKTIIALLLAIHRLKEEHSQIIFCAPTKPLVEQHLRTFQALTIFNDEELIVLTGSTSPDKRNEIYESRYRCLFTTPQVIQNDIISHRLDLSNVSLMIFDEAHRATGKYAYTYLAEKYVKNACDPKIIALTASPGKSKKKIEEVMQNLYLNEIEIRADEDPDVKPYIHEVDVIWKDVELPEEMSEIIDIFIDLKKKLYGELKEHGFLDSANVNTVSRKDLLVAGKDLDHNIIQNQNSPQLSTLLYLKKIMANSLRISHMHEVLETQGLNSLQKYIEDNMKKVEKNKGGKSLQELFSSKKMEAIQEHVNKMLENQINHPKIGVLMELLQEQFRQNEESRVLVFCQFRDTIRVVEEIVNENELIKAKRFIGQAKKGKHKGLTQKQQLELLDEFRSGEVNTLLATSVAEEGLDIAECDVVIFYDVIPSEIRTIQRRGRTGRSKEGTVYILKTKGTREEGYFWAEKHREREMKRVLSELKNDIKFAKNQQQTKEQGQTSLSSFVAKKTDKKEQEKNTKTSDGKKVNNELVEEKEEKIFHIPEQTEKPENKQEIGNYQTHNKEKVNNISAELSETEAKTQKKDNLTFEFKIIEGMGPYILADSRETASPVTRELDKMNAYLNLETLPIGDYIISQRCGIERKSIDDFRESLKDGRLFKELQKLRMQFSRPILIIEGNINSLVAINRSALLGSITSIILNMDINIYQTSNSSETAEFILALAKKEQKESSGTHLIRFKKIPEKMKEKLEYIVSGIPGINISRAKDLLFHFNTIENLFKATTEEICEVHNIGPIIAKKIKKYAQTQYHDA